MGTNISANLYFGTLVSVKALERAGYDFDSWESEYVKRAHPECVPPNADVEDNVAATGAYYKKCFDLKKAAGAAIDWYGKSGDEDQGFIVYAKGLEITAYHDEPPVEIKNNRAIPLDAYEKLIQFCKVMWIPFDRPKWYLFVCWS